jgi:hypothetical protein
VRASLWMTSNGGDAVTVRRRDKVDIVRMRASNEAMLLWTGLAAGVGATSGMAAVCGGFSACKVESNNDAATVDALRVAAFGGFSLGATGLLWSWFSDGSGSDEQARRESGRLQVGIGLGQVQMEVAW